MKIILVSIIFLILFSGCVQKSNEFTLMHDGIERTYLLYVPSDYNAVNAYPLLVVFHGGGENAQTMERKTRFSDLAEKEKFIAVYPNGIGFLGDKVLSWNSGYLKSYASEKNADDVAYTKMLIEKISSEYNINPDMVYAAGHSNGAMMAYRVGAELSDKFAVIASVSGSIGGSESENAPTYIIPIPEYPVSVIAIHGKKDQHVLYEGGKSVLGVGAQRDRVDMAAIDSVDFWAQYNECAEEHNFPFNESETVFVDDFSLCEGGSEVILYTLENGDHGWPGARDGIDGSSNPELDATYIIWDFFKNHPKVQK
ncbi:MAG: hypothetical protein COV47_01260 [Candidatus Diapherotrites archaeon CG11_big_fil_rev_8_21_14_0_20_37_9]|nr:MAG: hypothetical protein COV47_01260 [Candidatus Diapherotrites archaeon CG11_big_fil_rev_8_21_14_0_20_37_9]